MKNEYDVLVGLGDMYGDGRVLRLEAMLTDQGTDRTTIENERMSNVGVQCW